MISPHQGLAQVLSLPGLVSVGSHDYFPAGEGGVGGTAFVSTNIESLDFTISLLLESDM